MWGDKGQVVPASLLTATRESHFSLWKSDSLPLLEGTRKEFLTQVYKIDTSLSTTLKFHQQVQTLSSIYMQHTHTQWSTVFIYQSSPIFLLPTSSALPLQLLGMPTHKSWKTDKLLP